MVIEQDKAKVAVDLAHLMFYNLPHNCENKRKLERIQRMKLIDALLKNKLIEEAAN